jgi:hypothetical protein
MFAWVTFCICVFRTGVGIINQLGPDNLENLKKIAESYPGGAGAAAGNSRTRMMCVYILVCIYVNSV